VTTEYTRDGERHSVTNAREVPSRSAHRVARADRRLVVGSVTASY
jgi:hypothetical protein